FFSQADDGIRDDLVTGVQTCALPISLRTKLATAVTAALALTPSEKDQARLKSITGYNEAQTAARRVAARNGSVQTGIDVLERNRSEERRVGKRVEVGESAYHRREKQM